MTIMSEQEAKSKWCPFSRVNWNGVSVNRIPHDIAREASIRHQTHCIADQCMAWRRSMGEKDSGFCGLAGGAHRG
jgi:hypothetical protein